MKDFEDSYRQFGSDYSVGPAAARRGSFSRYLQNTGSGLGAAASQMGNGFSAPGASGAQEESSFRDSLDELTMGQFGAGLGRIQSGLAGQQQVGSLGVSSQLAAMQAKEAASLRRRSADQALLSSAASSGVSALGGIFKNMRSAPAEIQKAQALGGKRTLV